LSRVGDVMLLLMLQCLSADIDVEPLSSLLYFPRQFDCKTVDRQQVNLSTNKWPK